ncbi:unnamed protein product [Polarella glacialis]|uniref:Uncharacterized protein n=1 Tax=Polarella glacialis TaxID=89957 RepID=A0A813GAL7_POLGL|nr:unnamed protein product [Polarella glacialis]
MSVKFLLCVCFVSFPGLFLVFVRCLLVLACGLFLLVRVCCCSCYVGASVFVSTTDRYSLLELDQCKPSRILRDVKPMACLHASNICRFGCRLDKRKGGWPVYIRLCCVLDFRPEMD